MTKQSARSLPWVWDQTVGSALDHTAAQFPDRDALVFPGLSLRYSWSQLNHRVNEIAAALIALGHPIRRTHRNLVDERAGMGRHAVGGRADRRRAG